MNFLVKIRKTEFIEKIKNKSGSQNHTKLTVNENSKKSYKTQSQMMQNMLVQKSVFEEAVEITEEQFKL